MAIERSPVRQSPISAPRPGLGPESVRPPQRVTARELSGYLVWGTLAAVITVFELLAAFGTDVPFPSISATAAELERHHHWLKLVFLGGIVTLTARIVFYPWPNRRPDE
jgi:hypothetical protein